MTKLQEEIDSWAEDGQQRGRDRADRIQQYVIFLSGGGLIAVYTITSDFLESGQSIAPLANIAIMLSLSLIFSGLQTLLQMNTQTKKLDFRDKYETAKLKKDFEESKWEKLFERDRRQSIGQARLAQWLVTASLVFLILGLLSGLQIYMINPGGSN